jgi:hypothetical protein
MKEGSLFCSYDIHRRGIASDHVVSLVSLESSQQGKVHGVWFHDVWTCGAKVPKY